MVFRFFKLLHGRFWGIGALLAITIGAVIGYAIRPDLLRWDAPLSALGTDVKTSPFFAGSMFLSAYCLWRWRTYLRQTERNQKLIISMISLTILGLYLIALMPVTWRPLPYKLHHFGVLLAGLSMSLTVVLDSILSKHKKNGHTVLWHGIKFLSFLLIVIGGIISILSLERYNKLQLVLVGESSMFVGYSVWVVLKVYLGESKSSTIGRLVKKIFYS